jgi:chaperone required for assembly of F1-ATPase
VAVLKLEFEAMKIGLEEEAKKREDDRRILMEIRDAVLAKAREM